MHGLVDDQHIVFTGFGFDDVDYGPWLCTFHLTVSDADQVFCPQAVVNSHDPKQIITGPGFKEPGYGFDVFGFTDEKNNGIYDFFMWVFIDIYINRYEYDNLHGEF